MARSIEVHALTASMLTSRVGSTRLLEIRAQGDADTVLFFISPQTDEQLELVSLLELASHRDERLWSVMEERSDAWNSLVDQRLAPQVRSTIQDEIKQGFGETEEVLRTVWLVGDISKGTRHFLDSIVARWAALFLESVLRENGYAVQITSSEQLHDLPAQQVSLAATVLVAGGFVSEDRSGQTDAAMGAARFQAKTLTYWCENQHVTTADLNSVPGAQIIRHLSYEEATELSYFGSQIIRPHHMLEAMKCEIPIRLRSFANFEDQGTLVDKRGDGPEGRAVKGFSIVPDIALINVEGAGMVGVSGIAWRLFSALRDAGISIVLISQASSEYSICFAVPAEQAAYARATAHSAFATEVAEGKIQRIEAETGCAILAAVGNRMEGTFGIAGTFFGALGKAHVNVRAIAQGSSERNISAVIKAEDSRRALRALHAGFFLSNQTLSVGLFGPGNIGGTLLDQIADEAERLNRDFGVDIRIRAIADSHQMVLDEQGIDVKTWRHTFATKALPLDVQRFANHVGASYFPHAVIIDSTASDELPTYYGQWMERGIHVITPNKKAGTAPYEQYRELMKRARSYGKHFLYETTVGAGLPVIGTLKDMITTGDRIHKIEGIVSGTLAYLFSAYDGTTPFSTLVREAREMGYTEPDPREDLSGMDVARKIAILSREIGYTTELDSIEVVSLVPKELEEVPLEQFMQECEALDEPIHQLYLDAQRKGEVLRYVGTVDSDGTCHVKLGSYGSDHAFAQTEGTDNVVAFTSDRYREQPLVIRGPGAGPAVTAGGVFADLLRLSAYLGARIS